MVKVPQLLSNLRAGNCSACIVIGTFVAISALYWSIESSISPMLLNDLIDGPLICVSFVAGGYYLTWSFFNCQRMVDRAWLLRFGICLAWLGNGVWRTTRVLYAQGVLNGPIGVHDSIRGYMILIMVLAGVLHIVALDFDKGRPTKEKSLMAIASVALGIIGILALRRL